MEFGISVLDPGYVDHYWTGTTCVDKLPNSVDPGGKPHSLVSHQGIHCLLLKTEFAKFPAVKKNVIPSTCLIRYACIISRWCNWYSMVICMIRKKVFEEKNTGT